ncbi:lysylphosphatidylglycerol synthase transmembrane domain-containing protein [Halovivax limisalsi]|uniref:lysylphosphatidylglycerol synthase transmembrane domain-containing protein n=1 Tax=Halovivax limisalsi TaxID=1453760 RepID=UPI001FFD8ADE|nr:lysylphosphatidylglycerol synthase transmembrane domain-containing protein [Halovivax limisalsi]
MGVQTPGAGSDRSTPRDRLVRLGRRYGPILGSLLLVGALVVVARRLGNGAVVDAVASADPMGLALAAVVYAASWPLRGRRYADLLSPLSAGVDTVLSTAAVFVSQAANLVVPARAGDPVRAYVVNRTSDVPYSAGIAALAVERLFDLLAITAIACGAVGWLLLGDGAEPATLVAATDRSETVVVAAGIVALLAVGLCFVLALVSRTRLGTRAGDWLRVRATGSTRLASAADWIRRFAGDVGRVIERPRTLFVVGASSLAIWLLDAATAVLVLLAVEPDLAGPSVIVVGSIAVSVGNLAKVLPLSQGGIGLYEAAFTAIVVALAPIGAGAALAAAILDHALKNVLTLCGGALAAFGLGLSAADVRTGSEPADGDRHTF